MKENKYNNGVAIVINVIYIMLLVFMAICVFRAEDMLLNNPYDSKAVIASLGTSIEYGDMFDVIYAQFHGFSLLHIILLVILVVYTLLTYNRLYIKKYSLMLMGLAILFYPIYYEFQLGGIVGHIRCYYGLLPFIFANLYDTLVFKI